MSVLACSLNKIANDLPAPGSGPRSGPARYPSPRTSRGRPSYLPGNPTRTGDHHGRCPGHGQPRHRHGRGRPGPFSRRLQAVMNALLSSIRLLANSSVAFTDNCVVGVTANTALRQAHEREPHARLTLNSTSATTTRPRSRRRRTRTARLFEAGPEGSGSSPRRSSKWVVPGDMIKPRGA